MDWRMRLIIAYTITTVCPVNGLNQPCPFGMKRNAKSKERTAVMIFIIMNVVLATL